MSTNNPTKGSDKSLEIMRNFAQNYAKRTGTYFCQDLGVTAVVLEGLRSEEHTSELQSLTNLVCRLLLEKKKKQTKKTLKNK